MEVVLTIINNFDVQTIIKLLLGIILGETYSLLLLVL